MFNHPTNDANKIRCNEQNRREAMKKCKISHAMKRNTQPLSKGAFLIGLAGIILSTCRRAKEKEVKGSRDGLR